MPKDPRFNFYPDNWTGGTKRMSYEQKGAYLELLMLNFYCLSDGLPGFTQQEALRTLSNAAAYAALWEFLMPKFMRKGEYFCSERMEKEFHKSKKHSEKQSERANKRWGKNTADAAASACNGTGIGNGNGSKIKKEPVSISENQTLELVPRESIDDTLSDVTNWTEDVITGNDVLFINMIRTRSINIRDKLLENTARDHLALCSRYKWHKNMTTQQEFRNSLIKHLTEKINEQAKGNTRSNSTSNQVAGTDYTGL
jgi:uncharacterized protein YdaU (DUF1376 family)